MSLMWNRPKALAVFHALIKLDPKLEKQCLAWEARSRLGDDRSRPVDSRYIFMCERAPSGYPLGEVPVRKSFTLFDLHRQVAVGEPVVILPEAFDGVTNGLLLQAGLRVFERNTGTQDEYVFQHRCKRYALRKNTQGALEVVITQKYSSKERRYRETNPNGTFKKEWYVKKESFFPIDRVSSPLSRKV